METTSYIQATLALLFVVGLIGIVSVLLKKLSEKQFSRSGKTENRLAIQEVRHLDTKRRLMIIKRDNVEHLVLLGINSELLIESNIQNKNSDQEGGE